MRIAETFVRSVALNWVLGAAAVVVSGCSSDDAPMETPGGALAGRAYIVSEEHQDLTVIDLPSLTVIGRVATAGRGNHMAELNADFTKAYVSSPDTNEVIVVDTTRLIVTKRIRVGGHPTHLTLSGDGSLLAVMCEVDDAVAFIDVKTDEAIKFLRGFYTPHFLRTAKDGRYGYVANLGAHHVTRVDLQSLTIDEEIPLAGMAARTPAPNEGGFADAQIAHDGVLYAADRATGRVLVYDIAARTALPEIRVGQRPWIVYAEHPFVHVPLRHLVPNFGDRTVSLIDGRGSGETMKALPGDSEAFGVNYSSMAPDKAFVMNRIREDIAVVDTSRGEIAEYIPVGGNTETAATTPDGRWIVAAVSSAAAVVVIDVVTNKIVKRFENVGKYPWSVTIPMGQNYCH
jgi:YVTN family beta-propeller protein